MNSRSFYLTLLLVFISCHNKKPKEYSITIPIDAKNVIVVNQLDEKGRKQGLWHEFDTVNHRVSKEVHYKDNLLDSSYLEYKTDSPDTLIWGFYKSGKKHGEWKYWDAGFNQLSKIELYQNDTLKETKNY